MADSEKHEIGIDGLLDDGSIKFKSTTLTGKLIYCISYRCFKREDRSFKNWIILYDPESKTVVDRYEFSFGRICDVSNGKALITNAYGVQFYCLRAGKVLTSISANFKSDLSTGCYETQQFQYAKFDANPDRHQFVVSTSDLSLFQLMSYNNDTVTILHRITAFINSYSELSSDAVLLDGVVFTFANEATILVSKL
jgi:hypothetical protein